MVVTLLNLVSGFTALVCIVNGWYMGSALLILLAAVFDHLDGRIARKGNDCTDMGKQLDSLCDLVSFGVAPALLILFQFLPAGWFVPGAVAAVCYVLCGAYRLARFNISGQVDYFTGIPITMAGLMLALLSLPGVLWAAPAMMAVLVLLGVLMVSTLRIPKLGR